VPESAGCIGPTVLPREKRTPRCARPRMLAHPSGSALPNLPSESFAFCGAFPANRKIAFGGGRLAVRSFSHRSVPRGGRCSPRLHEARWRHFGASLLRQRSLSRRKAAHPCVDAGAWNGSEYLPRPLRLASAPACAVPPLSGSLAPQLMRLVRPRYSSRIPFPLLRRKRERLRLPMAKIRGAIFARKNSSEPYSQKRA
jgi:hypothetical protein